MVVVVAEHHHDRDVEPSERRCQHGGFLGRAAASEVAGEEEDVGFVWLEKSHELTATTGATGELWLALGVWGTFEVTRTYHIDDLEVVFTPR